MNKALSLQNSIALLLLGLGIFIYLVAPLKHMEGWSYLIGISLGASIGFSIRGIVDRHQKRSQNASV